MIKLINLIILLPLLVLLSNAYFFGFNDAFYHNEFEKIGTYDRVENADEIINNTFLFVNGQEDLKFFSDREKSHMEDVKEVVSSFFFALLALKLLVAFLIIKIRKIEIITKAFQYSLIWFTIVVLSLLFFNFSDLFTSFHGIFFEQGTWVFSQSDLLIQLFPSQFFQDISKTIILNALYQLAIATIALSVLNKLVKQRFIKKKK